MTGDEFRQVVDFEASLKPGDSVRVNWTNSNSYYSANATVAKVNDKSVVVTLDEIVPASYGTYPKGQKIRVPRIAAFKLWSCNNSVQPRE